ncbi:hypothetical protein M9H77_12749 [Catharanthus roseus]|uniref:Uncharacterized protein n=1 Tax=Catharanthus roseus TaxID=4058 RepID=A0ACC0BIA3_CATRO|nr:hypothetical protein M9H77_12749 [Catharanthus roseus]
MELKLGPMTRARIKKLKASNGNEDKGMVAYMEGALKNKFEEFKGQEKNSKLFTICLISKDYSREQFGVEKLKKRPYGDDRPCPYRRQDIKEIKKGKSSATIEQTVGDNFGGVNSSHHPRHYDNISIQGYHDMTIHNPYPFHEVGNQGRPQARHGRGGQGGRGYYRLHEEAPYKKNGVMKFV